MENVIDWLDCNDFQMALGYTIIENTSPLCEVFHAFVNDILSRGKL